MITVKTQAELDAALGADPNAEIDLVEGSFEISIGGTAAPWLRINAGVSPHVVARGSSQPHVVAWGSSQPHVVALESSQPHVEALESSQPHVVALESSQPHVEAWGSSQPHVVAWGSSQPHVVARGSSQPHVEARGSSQPHVVALESSQPHVVALESSQPHVEARGSSQPHVVAKGYVQLSLFGRVMATVTANVSVLIDGDATVDGGKQTRVARSTPVEWCDYYGVSVTDSIAILYKGLNADFVSMWGLSYVPGSAPVAPDWDGGEQECGKGLHFSPNPRMTLEFVENAKKFVACPVALSDMAVQVGGLYPQKVKARACCGPVYEVDIDGVGVVSVEARPVNAEGDQEDGAEGGAGK